MWEIYAYQNADSLFGVFNARDTVMAETPASLATSSMRTVPCDRERRFGPASVILTHRL